MKLLYKKIKLEKDLLSIKIENLDKFLDSEKSDSIPESSRRELVNQMKAMKMYYDALLIREISFRNASRNMSDEDMPGEVGKEDMNLATPSRREIILTEVHLDNLKYEYEKKLK